MIKKETPESRQYRFYPDGTYRSSDEGGGGDQKRRRMIDHDARLELSPPVGAILFGTGLFQVVGDGVINERG
ncbi:hypothetical protein ACHWQZ_G015965 [Mnemiopsis leidyi]